MTSLCMWKTAQENSRFKTQLDNVSCQGLVADLHRPAAIMAACAHLADTPELVSAAATTV